MDEKKSKTDKYDALRQRSEEILANIPGETGYSIDDLKELIHELQVHQIELDTVNDELLRSQEELQKSRDRYLELYNNAPVGYINLDSHFIIIDTNRTFMEMAGCGKNEIIKQGISQFITPESYPSFAQQVINITTRWTNQHFSLRSPLSLEVQIKPKNNHAPFYALLNVYPWKVEDSGKINLRISITDITDLKQAQFGVLKANVELKEKTETLQKYSRELEFANCELEAFSYSVSHDLRVPLRAIDGFSQILQEDLAGKLDQNSEENLRRIREASQSMGKLIDGLLNLSRIIAKEMDIVPINLSEMAASVAAHIEKEVPGKKLQFLIQPGLKAAGDPALMRLVMQNLLENAVKFSSKRPDTIIEFGVTANKERQVYFISDNGAGFDMAYADKLFKPFQRLHNTSEFPGTGIGLTIIQRIIHRHGGKVWAEGEVDKGAKFFFTLPEQDQIALIERFPRRIIN